MVSQDSWANSAGPVAVAGPGARLRAKREGLGWSLEQVADKLRLDVKYIQALEQDHHADIAAPVFVRGYLRSYATLLQLPADAIVECYAAADGSVLFDGPTQSSPKQHSSARALRWLVLIGVAIVVAAGVFSGQMQKLLAGLQPHTTVSQPKPPVVSRAAVVNKAQAPDISDGRAQPAPESNDAAAPSAAVPEVAPESPLATGAHTKLVLRSSEDCWVIISDATGKELLREHMRAGGVRVLEGARPPLQVLLGNSPAVTVEYNDKPFDQSRYSRNKVARFTLGADAH